jgi:hypothetical protein
MWNIIIGLAMVAGGLSGKLALRGTNSGPALAALGAVLAGYGVFQMIQQRKQQ